MKWWTMILFWFFFGNCGFSSGFFRFRAWRKWLKYLIFILLCPFCSFPNFFWSWKIEAPNYDFKWWNDGLWFSSGFSSGIAATDGSGCSTLLPVSSGLWCVRKWFKCLILSCLCRFFWFWNFFLVRRKSGKFPGGNFFPIKIGRLFLRKFFYFHLVYWLSAH